MDEVDSTENPLDHVEGSTEESEEKGGSKIDPNDVWGSHLNRDKIQAAQAKKSRNSPHVSSAKKRSSHASIFSKLLASDANSFVPSVKSMKRLNNPKSQSPKVETIEPKLSVARPKLGSTILKSDDDEPRLPSSVITTKFSASQPSSIFGSQRKTSIFMKKGNTSLSDKSFVGEDFGGLKSPEQKRRSGSWEAFGGKNDVDDHEMEEEVFPDENDPKTFAEEDTSSPLGSKPSWDAATSSGFGASLLKTGNPKPKPIPKPAATPKRLSSDSSKSKVDEDDNLKPFEPEPSPEKKTSFPTRPFTGCDSDSDDDIPSETIRYEGPPESISDDSLSTSKPCSPRTESDKIEEEKTDENPPVASTSDEKPTFSLLADNKKMKRKATGFTEQLSSAWSRTVDDERMKKSEGCKKRARETFSDSEDEKESQESKPKPKRAKTGGGAGAKGLVTENFVRVNLKKKKFVRGAKTLTGPKYKRQQWKARMKARAENGTDKCFKCGESGHWANKCKGKGKSSGTVGVDAELLAMKEKNDENEEKDDEPFPTLEDAAAMARGVKYETKANKKVEKVTSIYPEKEKNKPKVKPKEKAKEDEVKNNNEGEEFDFLDDDDGQWVVNTRGDVINETPSQNQAPGKERKNERSSVEPVFDLEIFDGKIPDTPKVVWNGLKTFGHTSFRPGQEEAVMRILCGLSTLVILSTGAGKSLCYKLPAFLYGTRKQALTLVISPLVSLMEDQVADLPPGVKGACLHTNMTPVQRKKVAEQVYDGQIHFLLMSPESLVGGGNNSGIVNFSRMPPVAFACIDEAHCLSEWSHHFRPSYLRVCKVLREQLNVQCMLGLTATATMTTAVSVAHHLNIKDFASAFIRGVAVPPNLVLSVSKDERRLDALIELLQGDRFKDLNSIIIYCTRRQETESIATRIRTCLGDRTKPKPKGRAKKYTKQASDEPLDWDAEPYHAGLSAAARKRVQNLFMGGRLKVVVATVAFGMGLDKSDVRSVIHYNLPKTFESYVQEIGRAGRDGEPAHCHLFLDENDLCELKKHTYGNTVDRYVLKKFVRLIFPPCKCREIHGHCSEEEDGEKQENLPTGADGQRLCHGHQRAVPIETTTMNLDVREEGIGTLMCYLELHPKAWIENHRPTYATCSIRCYGGEQQFKAMAKSCPPVAAAVAWSIKSGVKPTSQITFPVVEIADMMGWDAGPVKRELYSLQWTTGQSGPRKSGVIVEFSDLGFHFRSPGDLTGEELDEITDFLHDRVQSQERTEIHQLKRLFETLKKASFRDYSRCCDSMSDEKSQWLRQQLLDYFDEPPTHDPSDITMLSFARELNTETNETTPEENNSMAQKSSRDNYQLLSDVHSFINMYSTEHTLTGRAIARIFHGIGSPCFPTDVWGKVRRFWRSHLATDFNEVRMAATRELMKFR